MSYCTAKDGRNEMSAPFAHENGQISAVLTGRGIDGLEWLIVSGEGRLAQRRTAPAVEAVCAHGGANMTGMPYDRDGAPHLALIVEHRDGACCVADLDADGRLAQGAGFSKGTAGFAPCVDGSSRLVSADCAGGGAGVMLVTPGTDDAPVRIPLSGVTAEAATAVLPLEDGSAVVGRGSAAAVGFSPASTRWAKRCSPWRRTRRLNGWPPIRAGLSGRTARGSSISTRTAACWAAGRRAMTGTRRSARWRIWRG